MANRKYDSGSSISGPLREAGGNGGRKYLEGMPLTNDPDYVVEMIDFVKASDFDANDWTITTTEATGTATEVVSTGVENGVLTITNGTSDADKDSLQRTIEAYKLNSGKKLFMEMRLKVSDADDVEFMAGLAITDTTPLDASDRINFRIDEGDASIKCQNAKDSTETETDSGVDAADDTYVKLGILCDGTSSIKFYVNRNEVASHSTNIPDDEELCLTLYIENGAAAADSLTVDYIMICKER